MPVIYVLPDTGIADVVVFDAVEQTVCEETSQITAYPIESGALVADHVITNPRLFSMTGKVTNTPIQSVPLHVGSVQDFDFEFPKWIEPLEATPGSVFRAAGALAGAAIGAIGDALFGATPAPKLRVFAFNEPFNRPLEVETALQKIRDEKIPCTIVTETRQFAKMMLTSSTATKSRPGDKTFDLQFSELRIANVLIVDAPKPAELRGAPGTDMGAQSKKEVSSADSVKASSILVNAYDATRAALGGG